MARHVPIYAFDGLHRCQLLAWLASLDAPTAAAPLTGPRAVMAYAAALDAKMGLMWRRFRFRRSGGSLCCMLCVAVFLVSLVHSPKKNASDWDIYTSFCLSLTFYISSKNTAR